MSLARAKVNLTRKFWCNLLELRGEFASTQPFLATRLEECMPD